jgi:hypothetical protein
MFSLRRMTSSPASSSSHTPVGDLDLVFGVGGHGVPFGRGIAVRGDGLSDLFAIGLRHRGTGQQQRGYNGN